MIDVDKIFNQDCLEGMKDIPDKSVDMILTDPPYGVLNKSNPDAQWDKEVDLKALWKEYKRIIKPNGAILIFGQGLFGAQLIMSNPKWFKFDFVWDKERKSNFLNCKKMPMRQHEQVFVFYQKPPVYNPQMKRGKPNHSRGKQEGKLTNKCYGSYGKQDTIITDYKYPGTIIKFAKGHDKENWLHNTTKPVNLLRYLIRTYSNEGDVILDNFMGSGSTAIAAIMEKRHFIGFELNKGYYDKACERIENEKAQMVLDF